MRPIKNRRERTREDRDAEGSTSSDEPDEEDVMAAEEDWIRAQEF